MLAVSGGKEGISPGAQGRPCSSETRKSLDSFVRVIWDLRDNVCNRSSDEVLRMRRENPSDIMFIADDVLQMVHQNEARFY